MNLLSTTFYTGIATAIRTITGFALNKVVAIYVGPSGLAFFGQFQNFITIILSFGSGAISTGIVKYSAEVRECEKEKTKLFSTAFRISLVCSLITAVFLFSLSTFLSNHLFKTAEYGFVFKVFSFSIVLFVLNSLLIAILNGEQDIKRYSLVNISGSIIGLLITSFLVYKYALKGVLLASVISQSIVFFVTIFVVVRANWFKGVQFLGSFDKGYFVKLSKFSLMALTTAIVVPVTQIYLRNYVGSNLSWQEAGYWQALLRLSGAYLMLITTTLSVYYLPKLSSLQSNDDLRKEIFYGMKMIMPVVIVLSCGVYLFRNWLIVLLFTKAFMPMESLFLPQLIGDVLRIFAVLLGYLMVSKAMTKTFIYSEIFFNLLLVFLSVILIQYVGLRGLVYAYAVNNFIYIIFNVYLFREILVTSSKRNKHDL
ncbi:MAG: O-antigen translocase [Candidatus Cloacimonetes bacterium]|nr:O-antigen translocase [Candidatus Cloacimonadota bacterium]